MIARCLLDVTDFHNPMSSVSVGKNKKMGENLED